MITKHNYDTKRPPEKEMIFGIRAVIEAIDAGKTLDKVLLRRDMSSALGRELTAKLANVPTIAFLSPVEFTPLESLVPMLFEQGKVPFLMVLDGITDVRNFGAIARTCECAGVDGIVIAARSSVAVNGDAIKTSAGALHTLPVCKVANMQDALNYLRESGLRIVAATEHSTQNYTEVDMCQPLAIIMGSEEHGIYEANLDLATDKVRIPMLGKLESLNVSVAAGVMIYEAVRQRNMQ